MTDTENRNNLPLQATPFIGREREIAAVLDLLRQPQVRLLTLTGPGGTGKTRLSIEVARLALTDYPDGAFFVALESITDASLVIPTIAQTLDLHQGGGQSLLGTLKDYLSGKQMLLVLDNFEQVIAAASAVAELLKAALQLRVLTSSRVSLGVYGEQEYPVPPLDLPDLKHLPPPEQLEQYTAIALFTQRARAAKPSFVISAENATAVAEICVHLDGLPLAIELTAARIKLLTPQAIASRLAGQQGQSALQMLTGGARNLPQRQQTLRNLIDWSYNLLDDRDKALFARLAVFMGGCTIEAAEVVCNADGGLDVLNGMESLVDKSLLRAVTPSPISREGRGGGDEPRFAMLTTIREYALDQLRERDELDPMLAKHAEYYMQLVAQAEPELKGTNQAAWLARLEADYDNIRAALGWLLVHQPGLAVTMVGQLGYFWMVRGYLSEGREWLTAALQGETADKADLARALNGAGILAFLQGDNAAAYTYCDKALQLRRELNDKPGIAESLLSMGNVAYLLGDYVTAHLRYKEALAAARDLNDQHRIFTALDDLGFIAAATGDYVAGRAMLEEALQIARQLGYPAGIASALLDLGVMVYEEGEYDEARKLCEEGFSIAQKLGDISLISDASTNLGLVACAQGDYEKANELLEESLRLAQELGHKLGIAWALQSMGRVELAQQHYTAAAACFKQALQLLRGRGYKEWIAKALIFLGIAEAGAASKAAARRAVNLISSGTALLTTTGAVLFPRQAALKEAALAPSRTLLTEEEFAAAWAEGEAMTMEQAIEYALSEG